MKLNTSILAITLPDFSGFKLEYLVDRINKTFEDEGIVKTKVVKISVFYNPDQIAKVQLIQSFDRAFNNLLTCSFIAQPPLTGQVISLEVLWVDSDEITLSLHRLNGLTYTKITHLGESHLYIAGIESKIEGLPIEQIANEVFENLEFILKKENFAFTDIVRQWNYIEDITGEIKSSQNYQAFNDVRTHYYERNGLVGSYPAATGIGIKEGGIILEVHAIKALPEIKLVSIANPSQIDAFHYSQKVLEGNPINRFSCKTTPKFSRAMAIIRNDQVLVLVSGTASIQGELTVGLDDVEEQTRVTIQNIEQLVFSKALVIVPKAMTLKANYSNVRVYIKYPEHLAQVKAICDAYFNTKSMVYIESDICRSNLLVEIECMATLL
jgi:enamine deaminase RidA (YjgF/YER057c/UK114 family)